MMIDYDEEYYTEDEMEDEPDTYYQDVRSYFGDDEYDDERYEDYEYEVYTPVFTWGNQFRLWRIEFLNMFGRRKYQVERWLGFLKDPGAIVRRCKYCGKRGCVAGSEMCWNDTIPF